MTTGSYIESANPAGEYPVLGAEQFEPVEPAGPDRGNLAWNLRVIRIGICCTIPFQITHLAIILWGSSGAAPEAVPILLLDMAVTTAFLFWSFTEAGAERWRSALFGWCALMILSAAQISVATGQATAFAVATVLMLFGTAVFANWGARWQAFYVLVCLAGAVYSGIYAAAPAGTYEPFRLLELATVSAMSLIVAALTERHQRDLAARLEVLRDSEQQLWRIFESNPDAVTVADLNSGRYLNVSDQFLHGGYAREEVLSGSDASLGIWIDETLRQQFWSEIRGNGFIRNLEAKFRLKDGRIVACLVSGARVNLSRGDCVITVLRNVERLKRVERELIAARQAAETASRAKSDFLSSMSHEIRTPMNAILGMAEVLSDSSLTADQQKYLSIMTNNGNALLDLINDILDLARVESGRLKLERTSFDLHELAERVAETLALRAHQKQLELIVAIAPEVPAAVLGDPLRLRQILINLLGNAIKFTERGEIALELTREAATGAVHLVVRDSGIGIPADQLERIFASYAQADSSTARKYGGTGLGLAIVKQLAELMGGRIWVESMVGQGSAFHLIVPLETNNQVDSPLEPPGLAGLPVMVAEAGATNRRIISDFLARAGATAHETTNVAEALAWLKQTARGVVLLDGRIAGLDWQETAAQLTTEGLSLTRVIPMLTSNDLNVKIPLLRKLGFLRYLLKPAKRSELRQAIVAAAEEPGGGASPDLSKLAVASRPTGGAETGARTFKLEPVNGSLPFGRPVKILVADDSEDNRLLIEAFLRKAGCRLEHAENGEVALRKFKESSYDVILMDIQMPVMDGYRAVRAIREWEQQKSAPRTPVIALTASVLDEAVGRSFEAGCDTHVSKPVRRGTLLTAIGEVIAPPKEAAHKIAV